MTGKHKKRGFSLIEAAIVLAVVGLVLGGIWVAAAAMYENYKVNKTAEGILVTAKNLQNLIGTQTVGTLGNWSELLDVARDAGAVPKDWIYGSYVRPPIGGELWIKGITSSSIPSVAIIPMFVKKHSHCVKLIKKIGNLNTLTRTKIIWRVRVNQYITVPGSPSFFNETTTEPQDISLEQAESLCPYNVANIEFYILLTRNIN